MDPLSAGLNILNSLVQFEMKVWDKLPEAMQIEQAVDQHKFVHNIASVVLGWQEDINKLIRGK